MVKRCSSAGTATARVSIDVLRGALGLGAAGDLDRSTIGATTVNPLAVTRGCADRLRAGNGNDRCASPVHHRHSIWQPSAESRVPAQPHG
jgi:hypothetical protein